MIARIGNLVPRTTKPVGATLAEQHFKDIHNSVASGDYPQGTVIVLDFQGMETTNGSYLRLSALWFLRCGQLSVRPEEVLADSGAPTIPRPYDIYCVLANVEGEVAREVQDFFGARSVPMLVATKTSGERILSAGIVGTIEPVLKKTLLLVCQCGAVSATDLHVRFKSEGISVTAWNNRLADLCALRLLRRERQGKQWIYEPITKGINNGRSIH